MSVPATHHRTVVPWREEPALLVAQHSQLQLWPSGAVLHQAAGDVDLDSAILGIFRCRSHRGMWYFWGACVTTSTPPRWLYRQKCVWVQMNSVLGHTAHCGPHTCWDALQ